MLPHMDGSIGFARMWQCAPVYYRYTPFDICTVPEFVSQTASQSVQPFLHSLLAGSPYTLQWTGPFCFSKLPFLISDVDPLPSNMWFLVPTHKASQSRDHRFNPQLFCRHVSTLGKSFTHMCICSSCSNNQYTLPGW